MKLVNFIPTVNYFWLTIKHKWFVFKAGLIVKAPIWRLLTHDMCKFYPTQLPHYGRQFFGKADDPFGFIKCWLLHQNLSDHHWEYYIPRTGHNRCTPPYPDMVPIPMPEGAVREMIADWFGASRAYEGKWPKKGLWVWFSSNFEHKVKPNLHPDTARLVMDILFDVGIL